MRRGLASDIDGRGPDSANSESREQNTSFRILYQFVASLAELFTLFRVAVVRKSCPLTFDAVSSSLTCRTHSPSSIRALESTRLPREQHQIMTYLPPSHNSLSTATRSRGTPFAPAHESFRATGPSFTDSRGCGIYEHSRLPTRILSPLPPYEFRSTSTAHLRRYRLLRAVEHSQQNHPSPQCDFSRLQPLPDSQARYPMSLIGAHRVSPLDKRYPISTPAVALNSPVRWKIAQRPAVERAAVVPLMDVLLPTIKHGTSARVHATRSGRRRSTPLA